MLTATDVAKGDSEEVTLGDVTLGAATVVVGTEIDGIIGAARLESRDPSPGSTAVGIVVGKDETPVGQREGRVTGGRVVLIAPAAEAKAERMPAKSLAMDERAALPICSMMGSIGATVAPGRTISGRLIVAGEMTMVLLTSNAGAMGSTVVETSIDEILIGVGLGTITSDVSTETLTVLAR